MNKVVGILRSAAVLLKARRVCLVPVSLDSTVAAAVCLQITGAL